MAGSKPKLSDYWREAIERASSESDERRFQVLNYAYESMFSAHMPFGFGGPESIEEAIPIIERCIESGVPYRVDVPEGAIL